MTHSSYARSEYPRFFGCFSAFRADHGLAVLALSGEDSDRHGRGTRCARDIRAARAVHRDRQPYRIGAGRAGHLSAASRAIVSSTGLAPFRDGPGQVASQHRDAHFPMQKLPKIAPSKSSLVNSPVISPSARCASRRSSANSSNACVSRNASARRRHEGARARRGHRDGGGVPRARPSRRIAITRARFQVFAQQLDALAGPRAQVRSARGAAPRRCAPQRRSDRSC